MFSSHDKHEQLGPETICCSREVCLQTPVGISSTCPNFFQDLVLLSVSYLSKTKKRADTLSQMEWCWVCSSLMGIKCFLFFIFACSWRASISDKSLNLQIGESGENQISLENCNLPEPTLPDNIRCNNRKSIWYMYPVICVCAHTCFILTEINAVARNHPLAVDIEVGFDGGLDSSRVQWTCISLSLSGSPEKQRKEPIADTLIAQMRQFVWTHSRSTAAEFE